MCACMPSVYRQRVKPHNAGLQMIKEGVDHYRTSGVWWDELTMARPDFGYYPNAGLL